MKLHANARLSVKGRELLVDRMLTQGWSLAQAAEAAGVSERTACKWVARFRLEGESSSMTTAPSSRVYSRRSRGRTAILQSWVPRGGSTGLRASDWVATPTPGCGGCCLAAVAREA
jgi:transposase